MPDAPKPPPRRGAGTISVERIGTVVRFEVETEDEYAAMALYDKAVAAAQRGYLTINVETGGVVREH